MNLIKLQETRDSVKRLGDPADLPKKVMGSKLTFTRLLGHPEMSSTTSTYSIPDILKAQMFVENFFLEMRNNPPTFGKR